MGSRGKPVGVMFHNDQGGHYTSRQFRRGYCGDARSGRYGRRGNCWDNGPMEALLQESEEERGSAGDGLCKPSAMQLTQ